MAVNKVVMNTENGAETLIDLTGDSVTPATLAAGETAHDASGALIVGTATPVTLVQKTGTKTDAVMSQKAVTDAIANVAGGVIPDYWETYLDEKIATIKALQDEGGKDCFSFIVMSDIHYPQQLGKCSPLLAKRIMDECNIRYTLVLGDMQSRGQHSTKENAESDWDGIKEMFSPIADSVLYQKGNHDGSWGSTLNGTTYPYNFTVEEMYNRVYAPTYKYHNVTADESGTGYYVDDTTRKVRYIMLNTHCNDYAENSDGSATYSNMSNFRFTQSQYNMVIDALNSLSDGWAVVVAAHAPIENNYSTAWGGDTTTGDHVIMRNLLRAYKSKAVYADTWAGTNGYDAVSVSVDFTSAKGEFIAYFCGHMHNDYVYSASDYFGIDIITTRCDGATENNSTLLAERVSGTTTEQSFDVFTVNRNTGYVYATKIGAGSDRTISYSGTTAVTYTITNTLSYCTNSNKATKVNSGAAYTGTISANDGYNLNSVTVKMGGVDITSTAYSNGVVTIGSVTGNVVITAVAIEKEAVVYSITNTLTNCSTSNSATSIKEKTAYSATITAADGYTLDGAAVTVTMGGSDITSTAYSNGAISIPSVTGNIVITIVTVAEAAYTNIFDTSGDGYTNSGTKFYTNWLPYSGSDNGDTGTIYHFKGLQNSAGYTNPYKVQFKVTSTGTTSQQMYCSNANQQTPTAAAYDSSVTVFQHHAPTYDAVQFEIREALPDNFIITANEEIVDV